MGEPVEEYEEGNDCIRCWGVGKSFGDYPTPKRLYVTGSGFVGGCAVLNDTFIVKQTNLFPCKYELLGPPVDIVINFGATNTSFAISVSGVGVCYSKNEGLCVLVSTDAGKTVKIH